MKAEDLVPLVQVTRGDVVESIHHGALAVVDAQGKLLTSWGNPNLVTFMRSSAKPLQLLPLLERGGAARFQLQDEELALMCASHTGTDRHVEVLQGLQARLGIRPAQLLCGAALPADRPTWARFVHRGLDPDPLRHNCSGKHTGMLALAMLLGADPQGYVERHHPVQRAAAAAVAEMCGLEPSRLQTAVDGCSVPTFAVPLQAVALAFARLADSRALGEPRAEACVRIFRAMTSCPEMVAGEGSFDTECMRHGRGRLLSKGGAEGFLALAVAPGGHSPGVGIAIKVADGDLRRRARSVLAVELLSRLGALDPQGRQALQAFGPGPLYNARGIEVGAIEACLGESSWERQSR